MPSRAVSRSAAEAAAASGTTDVQDGGAERRPRVLLVGRTRYRLPLSAALRPKFEALGRAVELRVLASAAAGGARGDQVFELVPSLRPRALDGLAFYALLPLRVARELRRFAPDAVIAQSAYEAGGVLAGRALARRRTPLILEVHGDWRTATRLYGSRLRLLLAPLGDLVSWAALRRADAVRTVSPYTSALVRASGVQPADAFPAYMNLAPFLERPPVRLPARPTALFVGVLELYKNIDGLAEAWRAAAPRLPGAQLRIVGDGSRADVVERLLAELPGQTSWVPALSSAEVAEALDQASVLVLPSRSEGMGRVIVEALCRGRPVVGSRVGGIPDLIADGVNGILVEPRDVRALADALVRVLGDPELVASLSRVARESVESWLLSPDDYAARVRSLVEKVATEA